MTVEVVVVGSVIGCHIANSDVAPGSCVKRERWRVMLTWNNENGDDDMRRHHLDNVACPLMCQVIVIRPLCW